MSSPDDRTERQGRVLGELAELGLAFARDLKARVEAVTSVQDAEKLALAFHRVTRTVRLTLALESKLARERHEIGKLDRASARQATYARKGQVRAVVSRDIWNETEGEAAEALIEALDERLEEDALFAKFLDGPVEAAIARIRADLGLPANDGANDPAPSEAFPPTPWRSSA